MSYRRDWVGIKINFRGKWKQKHNLPEPEQKSSSKGRVYSPEYLN